MTDYSYEDRTDELPRASDTAEGPSTPKRKRRRKQTSPSRRPQPAIDLDNDLDLDDDDDLTLPSYGMRFEPKEQSTDDEPPRRPAKPQAARPQAERQPSAKPPAAPRKSQLPPRSQATPAARRPAPAAARPQAVEPSSFNEEPAATPAAPKRVRPSAVRPSAVRPPAVKPPAVRPPADKLPADKPRPERTRVASDEASQELPRRERRPASSAEPSQPATPRRAKPRSDRPSPERPSPERPRVDRPRAEPKPAGELSQELPPQENPPKEKRVRGRPPRERVAAERPRAAAPRVQRAHSAEFAALGLSEIMLDALAAAGYDKPTPVQEGFIPRALAGVDVMGQAQTGTGKTAAFAIPILEKLEPPRRGAPPQALALVPTRELAVQVRDECEKLAQGRSHAIVAVYGGKPIRKQIEQVMAGASMIVGTPGRVLDLMSRGALNWGELRTVVLDEADRMLDIGFRPDIEKILRRCPQGRQTLLLSATLAPPVKRLAERYMREPEVLDFSPKNLAVETIEQFYFTVDPERKFDLLTKLLEREDPVQAIIFCRTKRGTEKVHMRLARQFHHVDTIHGDLQQSSRDRVMKGFREGKIRWLVATDVVGRGIDVTGISHIINFDIPQFCDDYVHRVGRTGRMGREGVAYSFVTPEEGGELTRIEMRINRLLKRDEIPGFQAFGDPRAAEGVVLGEGPGYNEDDYVEPTKAAPVPVFGKPVRRIRRAL